MKELLIKLPTPSSISLFWNFGSLLGLCLILQIITGIFLAMHYSSSIFLSFESVLHITMNVNWGWMIRALHANGATFFFLFVYIHIGRGMIYKSFSLTFTWTLGMTMFLLFMMVAFMGYVLPWGQMSYWGATVITNLISALPYVGETMVEWVWGGFSVSEPTLTRFFTLHFFLPFASLGFVISHLFFLHLTGSNNPLGLMINSDKVSFHPFFMVKDIMGFVCFMFMLTMICLYKPYMFMDPDNFIEANPLITPVHIQPEWYFLFAYAILRSVPNKLGGVTVMLMSVLFLFLFPLLKKSKNVHNSKLSECMTINHTVIFVILTWIGSLPVEDPYFMLGSIFSWLFFVNLTMMMLF